MGRTMHGVRMQAVRRSAQRTTATCCFRVRDLNQSQTEVIFLRHCVCWQRSLVQSIVGHFHSENDDFYPLSYLLPCCNSFDDFLSLITSEGFSSCSSI